MIIGLAQYKFINGDTEFNLSQIKKAMETYSGKTELLCFGESFLQGFDAISGNYDDDKNVAVAIDSAEFDTICTWSKEYNVAVLFGYFEKEDDSIYSSCAVISRGEVIHNYRRTSIGWREPEWTSEHYKEGEEINTFSLNDREFLIALCGDLWDKDWEKFKTDAIVLWPVYVTFDLDDWKAEEKEYVAQASNVAEKVLMINSICESPASISHGGTFYFKSGDTISKLPYDAEDVLLVEV